ILFAEQYLIAKIFEQLSVATRLYENSRMSNRPHLLLDFVYRNRKHIPRLHPWPFGSQYRTRGTVTQLSPSLCKIRRTTVTKRQESGLTHTRRRILAAFHTVFGACSRLGR